MKLMKRLMKKNNKGMSLVELICAVAILGLTTTALGGAMVMSAQHYYRDSAEFEVQQDAQTATNLINNLVTDAADADWADDKLTITADNKIHVIYQDGDKLVYENTSDGTKGVLAEGLPAGAFEADTSKFDDNKSVNISLTVKNGDNEFTSNSNATSRNGELSTAEFAEKVCVISAEELIVIEPNQHYEMDVDLLGGMTIDEVGGISLDRSAVLPGWDDDNFLEYDEVNKKVILNAPPSANGHFQFKLSTGNKPDGTPWDTHDVTVRVRRVSGISINKASGDGFTAGSEYVFAAAVVGDNLSKCFGRDFDFDYKNPKWVKFEVNGVDYEIVPNSDNSKTETPNITIRLKEDMTPGSTFSVTAISYHAAIGQVEEAPGVFTKYNKTGTHYDWSVRETWTSPPCPDITPTPTIDPDYPKPVLPSGMMRGMDYIFDDTVDPSILKGKLATKYGAQQDNIHFDWCVSFKEITDPGVPEKEWTPYHFTVEAGGEKKVSGDWETTIMLPDKAYDIRFFVLYYNKETKEVLYPHDESLLNDKGIKDAGFKKGWADEDAAATTFVQYGEKTQLPVVDLYYYRPDPNWYDGVDGVELGVEYDSVGTKNSPKQFNLGSNPKIYYNMRHLSTAAATYTYTPVLWKLNTSNDTWEEYTNVSYQQTGGSPKFVQINQIQDKGTYRMGLTIAGTAQKYKMDRADSTRETITVNGKEKPINVEDVTLSPMKLYDETGTDGFFYFEIK